jgi:hypothetical protein
MIACTVEVFEGVGCAESQPLDGGTKPPETMNNTIPGQGSDMPPSASWGDLDGLVFMIRRAEIIDRSIAPEAGLQGPFRAIEFGLGCPARVYGLSLVYFVPAF